MESFVLNLFSDQLEKIIHNFHPSQINANFLSGKGSITNVKLNVDLINDLLKEVAPFLEFTEITLTELRVEVTSYTNLKKAPIVLVIEEIYAKAREPLEYHVDPTANAQKKAAAEAAAKKEAAASNQASQKKPAGPQPYGLLHRILDNLSLKAKRINLSFSSLGKFKTRRRGVWTPPTLQVSFDNVEWIGVTETGNPGTPEQVWAHNELWAQQSRFRRDQASNNQQRHRSYTIYKRLSMLCSVKLLPSGENQEQQQNEKKKGLQFHSSISDESSSESISTLISNTKMDVHLAYVRRLRDAGVTGADMDVQIYDVDINLDVASYKKSSSTPSGCDVGVFVHMLVGLLHCYYKDRSFVDPLLPKGVSKSGSSTGGQLLRGFGGEDEKEEEVEAGPDDFLPEVAMMDDDLDSSDESDYDEEPDEEHDEAFLAWKRSQEGKESQEPSSTDQSDNGESTLVATQPPTVAADQGMNVQEGNEQTADKSYKRKRKAVIVVASGAQKFEKLSFSFTLPRLNMKLCLPAQEKDTKSEGNDSESSNCHCLELLLEGLSAECIWPKNKSGEIGGHVQGSIKYFQILESAYRMDLGTKGATFGPQPWNVVKISPLLRVGTRLFQGHDSFALSPQLKSSQDGVSGSKCDEFPLMENRETTWKWDRRLKGPRAAAFKSTVSFVDEELTRWSRTDVVHEASMGELEVVLDSAPVERLITLFSDPRNEDSLWFDERWLTGRWQTELTSDMLAVDEGDFHLKDHLQPLPSIYPTNNKQSPLSSELRSVTAHFDAISVKLPNPMVHDLSSFRMSDVIFGINETTILVNNYLPSSFLVGVVAAENNKPEFPHDPTDSSCTALSPTENTGTKFRMQVTLSDCSLKVLPVQAYSMKEEARKFSNLIAPTNVTLMICLEHKNGGDSPLIEADDNATSSSQSLILSVLVHEIESNIELRSINGALETLNYHAAKIVKEETPSDVVDLIPSKSNSADEADGAINTFSIICVHVPEVAVNLWGQDVHKVSAKANEAEAFTSNPKLVLLCQVKASQLEYGMESMCLVSPLKKDEAVHKCALASVVVTICSSSRDENGCYSMMDFLSMGSKSSDSSLVENAYAFCFPDTGSYSAPTKQAILLRSESIGTSSILASSLEISSEVIVDLNITSIEFFLNLAVEGLLAPVFTNRNLFNQLGQTPLGSAMWSNVSQVSALFASPTEKDAAEQKDEPCNFLSRMTLHRLLVLIPSSEIESKNAFGAILGDAQVASGTHATDELDYQDVLKKTCGSGNKTWMSEFFNKEESTDNFYVMTSKHALLNVGSPASNTHQFNAVIPESSINWSHPVGLNGTSTAPPFDISSMKDLGMFMYNMGMGPMSTLYFKLYKLSPQSESAQTEFSSAATRLHDSIGSYHITMHNALGQMNAEINRLRKVVFSKENERVGALALASSTAAGWVRVGEDLSFSHRIFSSATFWRYWMVLHDSMLVLYTRPGTNKPSAIIPLRTSSQLRGVSMSSSSNKGTSGIVGNHIQQKGFAVFDSADGTGLFFVAPNDSDYNMWVSAISTTLKKGGNEPATEEDDETKNDNMTSESGETALSTDPSLNDNGGLLAGATNQVDVPLAPAAQTSDQSQDPFEVFDGMATAPLPQAPNADPLIGASETMPVTEPNPADTPAPAPPLAPAIETAGSMDSDLMEDVEMDDVSLGDSDRNPNNTSAADSIITPTDISSQQPTQSQPRSSEPRAQTQQQNANTQPLPMRERLALAKGKSKMMASSKFGSALKSAKGGMLAASEIGRDGVKQAMAKESSRKEEQPNPNRSLVAGRQKMSMLKNKANTKLAAARTSVQDQLHHARSEPSTPPLPPSSSRDELIGNVGQKMSMLKKNASTKLTAVRTSIQEQQLKRVNTEDSSDPPEMRLSHDEPSANRSSKQELRKKFANLDGSMSNTMRRLKIDEKVSQIGAVSRRSIDAVKIGVKNDAVMRLSHSRNSDSSRPRIGLEESKSTKPIKFDARETFSASSELPLKVKNVSRSDALIIDDALSERLESLQKIEGSWIVAVDAAKVVKPKPLAPSGSDNVSPVENSTPSMEEYEWKYRITLSNMACETNAQTSVEKSMSEILMFHTNISEIMTIHLPSTSAVFQEGLTHTDTLSPVLQKLSPLERWRVSGTILQSMLEMDGSDVIMRDKQCELMRICMSTLLECPMPDKALMATKTFLNIDDTPPENSDAYGTYLTTATYSVDEAFDRIASKTSLKNDSVSQPGSFDIEPGSTGEYSSLLAVVMDGYTKAVKERDEALASLATSSIISDNRIMQEQLAKSSQNTQSKTTSKQNSSDADMLNLCKQLGDEIATRTAAETAIKQLNERLQFERNVAEAKEKELRAELERYKKSSVN